MTGDDDQDPPARLVHFWAEEWPGGPGEWGEAAKAWLAAQSWPVAAAGGHGGAC